MSNLSTFCKTVLEIIALPEKDRPKWFTEKCGLCYNARSYDDEQGSHSQASAQLIKAINGEDYPFNSNVTGYDNDYLKNIMYKNKKRLAFLRKHAKV